MSTEGEDEAEAGPSSPSYGRSSSRGRVQGGRKGKKRLSDVDAGDEGEEEGLLSGSKGRKGDSGLGDIVTGDDVSDTYPPSLS